MTLTHHVRFSGVFSRRIFLSLILLVAMLGPSVARVDAAEPAQPITLRVHTPAYQIDEHGVTVPGYGAVDTPGAPALPMWSTAVELPPDGDWSLEVETLGAQRLVAKGPIRVRACAQPGPQRAGRLAASHRSAG